MKKLFLIIITAVVLLSFTVINTNRSIEGATSSDESRADIQPTKGFVLEDRNQWD